MFICDHCATEIPKKLPFSCKFCGGTFCKNHYLPENHNCLGLEIWKDGWSPVSKDFSTLLKILLVILVLLFLFLVLVQPELLKEKSGSIRNLLLK